MSDDPNQSLRISQDEKDKILATRGNLTAPQTGNGTPFKPMLTNFTVWIVMICEFANIWGILVMINEGPNFIDKVLHQDISKVLLLKISLFHFAAFYDTYKQFMSWYYEKLISLR